MNVGKFGSLTLIAGAALVIAAPVAQADTGSSELIGPSGLDIGCLIRTLSADTPQIDCSPLPPPLH